MSNYNGFRHDYFSLLKNVKLMQTREAVVNLINGRPPQCNLMISTLYGCEHGLDFPDQFECDSDDLTDSSDEDYDYDDTDYRRQNSRYCGFPQNFLDKGVPSHLPGIKHYKTLNRITPEEASKNAKELVDEEEKLKKKAEKKKQKKMRQRERRRQEKLDKENRNKDTHRKDNDADTVKPKPTENKSKNMKELKKNNRFPPDRGPQCSSVTTESSDSCDEDNDGEKIVDDFELDMSSCFVSNAAAIAKRKLEQKPKSDGKDKKPANLKKNGPEQKSTADTQIKNVNKKEASEEAVNDNVTKSVELAVVGNKYAQTGNLDMAVKYFTDAIKHNPQEVKLFGNRAYCYERMHQYEKALIDSEIALSLNPTWIKGLYRKGKALVGLKRYYEAVLSYKEVLKLDSSCTDAAQELMRVQIMQLMDMGYTRDQSSNALIIHGTVEKALEALCLLQGSKAVPEVPIEEEKDCPVRNPQSVKFTEKTVPQNPPKVSKAAPATLELFPVWVGELVPAITQLRLHELFSNFGPVHSIKVLQEKRCAFVNYTNKEDCRKAIQEMHGYPVAGTCLRVRYPDRIHTHLGISKTASTDSVKVNMFPDECVFWRTSGCIKQYRCQYRHVPEHKGIDRPKVKS